MYISLNHILRYAMSDGTVLAVITASGSGFKGGGGGLGVGEQEWGIR